MKHLIDAVYANGAFRPKEGDTVDLAEGEEVRLIVVPASSSSQQARDLAMQVFTDLSERDLREISQVALTSHGFKDSGQIDRAE